MLEIEYSLYAVTGVASHRRDFYMTVSPSGDGFAITHKDSTCPGSYGNLDSTTEFFMILGMEGVRGFIKSTPGVDSLEPRAP